MTRPSIRKPVQNIRQYVHRLRRKLCIHEWIQNMNEHKGCIIHPSLEFIGLFPPFNHLTIAFSCTFDRDVTIWISDDVGSNPNLLMGEHSGFGRNCYIGVYQPITIGSHVMVGAYSYIISANHCYDRRDCSNILPRIHWRSHLY